MDYRFDEALPVLQRTPAVLRELLGGLPSRWIDATEGSDTWSPFAIVGHLIHGERTDWIPRVEHILAHGDAVPFPPFDREAMFTASKGLSLGELLDTFARLRAENLDRLAALKLTDADLARRGRHPDLGAVTLGQHLSTWVAHDLSHIVQVARVMARQYTDAVGPWRAYLSVLRPPAEAPTPAATSNVRQAVPFLGVRDVQASLRFYVDGLGFTMTKDWSPEGRVRWCWLELGDAALMLQEYWKDGKPGGAPEGPLGQGVTVCLMCADALAVYRDALMRGLSSSRPFVGNHLWVTSFTDPDGYRLDFESPTDVPEGTVFAELADPA
ncbi:MAG: DinB family protein [Vicinamibacterales bacterium]